MSRRYKQRRVIVGILVAGWFAGGGIFLGGQRHHLAVLRTDLERGIAARGGPVESLQADGGRGRASGQPADAGVISTEGEEYLVEAGALVARMAPVLRGKNYDEYGRMIQSADFDRLRWLLSRMGGRTFLKLLEAYPDMPDPGLGRGMILQALFTEMNPEQALELAMAAAVGTERNWEVIKSFGNWTLLEPEAALRWYRKNEAGDEILQRSSEIRAQVMRMEVRARPGAMIGRLIGDTPANGADDERSAVTELCESLGKPAERVAFLESLAAAARDHPEAASKVAEIRGHAVACLGSRLMREPYAGASAVLDAVFTPEEKRQFTETMVAFSIPAPEEWPRWAPWVAEIDAPVDPMHPLVQMAVRSGDPMGKYGEPRWLDGIAPGQLRDLAVESYIKVKAADGPAVAAHWLSRLPDGEKRQEMARLVAKRLEGSDPPAAAALRMDERIEGPEEH